MKFSAFVKKLARWSTVMATTRTVSGPWAYFHRTYLTFTLTTLLARLKQQNPSLRRNETQKKYDREFTIRNSLGTFAVNAKNDSLTKSIISFEAEHQSWIKTNSPDIFIDIGANIGFYSFLALQQFGYKEAHAFEPNPETYHRLETNVTLNKSHAILHTHNIGLGRHAGTATLHAKPQHTGASSMVDDKPMPQDATHVLVPIAAFDTVVKENAIDVSRISCIKIDIEGYEFEALQGMHETLARVSPGTLIFIEIHPHAPHAAESHTFITSHGFTEIRRSPQHNFLYQK